MTGPPASSRRDEPMSNLRLEVECELYELMEIYKCCTYTPHPIQGGRAIFLMHTMSFPVHFPSRTGCHQMGLSRLNMHGSILCRPHSFHRELWTILQTFSSLLLKILFLSYTVGDVAWALIDDMTMRIRVSKNLVMIRTHTLQLRPSVIILPKL